jgi:hypothetical protein
MQVVKHEIKSQLAKLLATEDLIVEHRSVETAQFDVRTRVLTLPNWEKASNDVYDMLVGHEVGHALYTPDIEWFKTLQIPPSFVNIVEDVRIEKLMKRRYAGLAKTFRRGYNELSDNDFFEVDGKDLDTLNLADRVNLYFKIGAWIDISFSVSETPIVNLIANAETFDDTLSAAEALYNLCKQELEQKRKEEEIKIEQNLSADLPGNGDNSSSDSNDDESTVPNSNSDASMEDGIGDDDRDIRVASGGTSVNLEPEIETADSLEEALRGLNNLNSGSGETRYIELPKVNLKSIIIPNNTIHDRINAEWVDQEKAWKERSYHISESDSIFDNVDSDYYKFKKSAQKEVNYLVKEFECKKSASAYARATTSRTGILDTTKLHTYKFNEDLFKKVTVIPDGKNHGLVFVLDWSGSMAPVMTDTIKQLYNLLWFCKKVNIPFDVYAFTDSYPADDGIPRYAYERKEGLALVSDHFSMMNIFTSSTRSKELEEQMKNIFRIAAAFDRNSYTFYSIPLGMNLSGTPLNEAIISLHEIIPQFKSRHNLEKVQCVILTDGESAPLHYSKEVHREWDTGGYMGANVVSSKCVIRNRKTGYTYSCQHLGYWADVTDLLLQNIRQELPNTNFIGIRLMGSRQGGEFIRRYTDGEVGDRAMSTWRKEKSISIKESGYHVYFGLLSSTLCNDDEFTVKDDATKTEIKRAFVKSLKTKKMNKKILGEFVELVA